MDRKKRRMKDLETDKMLEIFLDFYGLEVFDQEEEKGKGVPILGRFALRLKADHLSPACLTHVQGGIIEEMLGYSSKNEIVEDFQTAEEVSIDSIGTFGAVVHPNVFNGCRSLEEMLVRRDLGIQAA